MKKLTKNDFNVTKHLSLSELLEYSNLRLKITIEKRGLVRQVTLYKRVLRSRWEFIKAEVVTGEDNGLFVANKFYQDFYRKPLREGNSTDHTAAGA